MFRFFESDASLKVSSLLNVMTIDDITIGATI